jgi:hypothetical protein
MYSASSRTCSLRRARQPGRRLRDDPLSGGRRGAGRALRRHRRRGWVKRQRRPNTGENADARVGSSLRSTQPTHRRRPARRRLHPAAPDRPAAGRACPGYTVRKAVTGAISKMVTSPPIVGPERTDAFLKIREEIGLQPAHQNRIAPTAEASAAPPRVIRHGTTVGGRSAGVSKFAASAEKSATPRHSCKTPPRGRRRRSALGLFNSRSTPACRRRRGSHRR